MKLGRKATGGRYKKFRKKKLYETSGNPRIVVLGKEKKKNIRVRGGNFKTVMLMADKANVLNSKTHKSEVAEIKQVIEVPSNKFLARKNIIVKGAVIETSAGKARVTNRPSQEGSVQAILI